MKTLTAAILNLCLMSGCATFQDACHLSVENGSGTGNYTPLTWVKITADTPPAGEAFCAWVGDISGLENEYAPATSIFMNQRTKTITATYSNVPTPRPGPTPGPAGDYFYVEGDKGDKGAEVWNPNYNGMDVRLSADDVDNLRRCGIPAQGDWYALDGDVVRNLTLSVVNGGITVTGADFVSDRTGAKYHFCGVLIGTSSSQLVPGPTITIPHEQCKNTLRIMYATVKPTWFYPAHPGEAL